MMRSSGCLDAMDGTVALCQEWTGQESEKKDEREPRQLESASFDWRRRAIQGMMQSGAVRVGRVDD